MKSGVIARPGDLVTCPEGHTLYRVRSVLIERTKIKPADFKSVRPDMPEPKAKDAMALCPDCGGQWWRSGHGAQFQVHFSDGWRPKP